MKKTLNNQLTLFLRIKTLFETNSSAYLLNVYLSETIVLFNTYLAEVLELQGKTNPRKAMSTTAKADAKKGLADTLLHYQARLLPWFMHHPDPHSPMETRLTPSKIKYAPDADLLLIATKTYDYVEANLAALAAYGFTAGMQTDMNGAMDAFSQLSDMPRRELNNRKHDQIALKAAIEKTRKLLREVITPYMQMYQFTNATFYGLFTHATKLGKPGNRTMALRVITRNDAGQPLALCMVSVMPAGGKPILKVTGDSGIVRFQNLPHGLCSITVTSANGDNTQTKEAEIKSSERADVVFVL